MKTIRRGDKGHPVPKWQHIIGVKADGIFGPATEAATKAWQAANGLVADGIVGPKTWAKADVEDLPKAPGKFPFVQAKHFKVANRMAVDLIVIHTIEAPERTDSAERCARFFT